MSNNRQQKKIIGMNLNIEMYQDLSRKYPDC